MRKIRIDKLCLCILLTAIALISANLGTSTSAQSGKKLPEQQTNDPFKKKNQRPTPTPTSDPAAPQGLILPNKVDPTDIIKIKTALVTVETTVRNKKTKQLVKNLKKENFAIFEDGVQKTITNFSADEAPITITAVMEYSKLGEIFGQYGDPANRDYDVGRLEVLRPVAMFLTSFIKPPNDYASVIAFDMRPTPITDFTNDPARIQQTIGLLFNNHPAFSESNLFDAMQLALIGGHADSVVLEDSTQEKSDYAGMISIQGHHKAIMLVASGIDTFSKINYDKIRKIAQAAGIPIYIIQTGQQFANRYGDSMDPGQGNMINGIPIDRMTFLQAQNTMKTFAKETGGAYFPLLFIQDLPTQLQQINDLLRSQYSLGYNPGGVRDGKQHKIVVKVDINGDGTYNDKTYEVSHRQFYIAPKPDK